MNNTSFLTDHQCPTCGKSFTRKSGLRIHLPSHSKQANYACRKGCEKLFIQSNDRNRHERSQHGDKVIICEGCGERFGRKDALYSHLRSKAGATCKAAGTLLKIHQPTSKTNANHTDNARQLLAESQIPVDASGSADPTTMDYIKYLESENDRIQDENILLSIKASGNTIPRIRPSTSDTNEIPTDNAFRRVDPSQQSGDEAIRRYWSFTYKSLTAIQTNMNLRQARPELSVSPMQCNVCFAKFSTDTSLAMHLMEHVVQFSINLVPCPLCSQIFEFHSTLASHLHNTSKRCSQTIQTRWKGKIKSLSWGCGKNLSEGESHHHHLDRCFLCLDSVSDVENALCLIAFEQLTHLWVKLPGIVPRLDSLLRDDKAQQHWYTRGDDPLWLLHEQIKKDSAWVPILERQGSDPSNRLKEIRYEDTPYWREILKSLEDAPDTFLE